MVALRQRQHVDLAVQMLAQADVGGDQVERADVALAALRAHARRRLLPVVALVGRVADRRHRVGDAVADRRRSAARATSTRAGVVRRVLDFEERIAAHRFVHFLGEIERRELQQADCVLQPRRDGVLLALARLRV